MSVRPFGWCRSAALLLSILVMGVGLACKKSESEKAAASTNFTVSGTVKYTRIPMNYDAAGKLTGLVADSSQYTTVPARGVNVRIFQKRPQTDVDYQTVYVWTEVTTATTDADGKYSTNVNVLKGYETFVEVVSSMVEQVSPASTVVIRANADGVYSPTQIVDREVYALRKAADGTTSSTDPTHGSMANADATVDFTVGLNDPWMVVKAGWYTPASKDAYPMPPSVPLGSRALAILDSIYEFCSKYGNATPTLSATTMDLHYRPGVSTRRGTFVEYNARTFQAAFDGSTYHFLGSIQGGGSLNGVDQPDDAYDLGTLYPLFAHNMMYGQRKVNMIPTGSPAPSMAPDLAVVEGFPDAMAAILLGTPYLPAGTGVNRYASLRDIRDLSGYSAAQIGPFSAPAITALTWDLALYNAGVTAPGTYADWKKLDPLYMVRFYNLTYPTTTSSSGNTTITTDCPSLYTQLARLQEAKSGTETSDLAAFFTDAHLITLLTPYSITWTTAANAILPKYTANWGNEPNSLAWPLPSFKLSMALAKSIKHYWMPTSGAQAGIEQAADYYPNNAKDEVYYARLSTSLDHIYNLSVTTVPSLPAGAAIEIIIDGDMTTPFLFPDGATVSQLTLKGNPADLTEPVNHTVRIRMFSPTTLVSDTQVTVHLEKIN